MTHPIDNFKYPVVNITTENLQQLNKSGVLTSTNCHLPEIIAALAVVINDKSDTESAYLHLSAIRLQEGKTTSAQAILRKAIKNCKSSNIAKLTLITTFRMVEENYYSVISIISGVIEDEAAVKNERSLASQLLVIWTLNIFGLIEAKCEYERIEHFVSKKQVPWFNAAALIFGNRSLEYLYEIRNKAIDPTTDSTEGQEIFLLVQDYFEMKDPHWISKAIDVCWCFDYSIISSNTFKQVADTLSILCGEAFAKTGDDYWVLLSFLYSNPRSPVYSDQVFERFNELAPLYPSKVIERNTLLTRWWSGNPDTSILIDIVEYEREHDTGLIAPTSILIPTNGNKPKSIVGIRANEILFAINSGIVKNHEISSIWNMISRIVINIKNQNHERLKKGFALKEIEIL
jgi:hypothetical protein